MNVYRRQWAAEAFEEPDISSRSASAHAPHWGGQRASRGGTLCFPRTRVSATTRRRNVPASLATAPPPPPPPCPHGSVAPGPARPTARRPSARHDKARLATTNKGSVSPRAHAAAGPLAPAMHSGGTRRCARFIRHGRWRWRATCGTLDHELTRCVHKMRRALSYARRARAHEHRVPLAAHLTLSRSRRVSGSRRSRSSNCRERQPTPLKSGDEWSQPRFSLSLSALGEARRVV